MVYYYLQLVRQQHVQSFLYNYLQSHLQYNFIFCTLPLVVIVMACKLIVYLRHANQWLPSIGTGNFCKSFVV